MVAKDPYGVQLETEPSIREFADQANSAVLAIVAPFAPTKVSPRRALFAELAHPEEFMVEEFVDIVEQRYPDMATRPPLRLLLHTPGGWVTSSYVIASVLRETFKEIVGVVPHQAASGGTAIAMACNQLVMGRVSRLTAIDPFYSDGVREIYPTSYLSAWKNLNEFFGSIEHEDAPYPWVHAAESISAEMIDRATRMMEWAESNTTDLLTRAGYSDETAEKIVQAFLWESRVHEEVFRYDRCRSIGLNVTLYTDDESSKRCWNVMRDWLKTMYWQPSPVHFIRYVLPTVSEVKS